MSRISTAVLNVPLTTYAQGIMQDRLAVYRLANLLCPIVQVTAAVGTYKKFDDRNSFAVEDMNRPIGGTRKRLAFDASDGAYSCKPFGVEIPVDDFEVALSGGAAMNPVAEELLTQGKMKSMLSRKATGYASRVTNFVFSKLAPVANRGTFSNPDIDPMDQIDEQLDALATMVGTSENIQVIMGLSSWRMLRGNANVKKRFNLTASGSPTREQITQALLYPVQLEISAAVATTTKRGQATVAKGQLMSNYVIIQHSIPGAQLFDPSPFKCFSTSSVLVDAVRTYRDESSASDVHAMDWSEDIEQTGPACAVMLAVN